MHLMLVVNDKGIHTLKQEPLLCSVKRILAAMWHWEMRNYFLQLLLLLLFLVSKFL